MQRQYVAIDLKSFYASAECARRNIDALDANLVVADEARTDKTICLAVSPSLKAYGIKGRCRLFEVKAAVKAINEKRLQAAPGRKFSGKSVYESELKANPALELDFIVAKPNMAYYIEISSKIYQIYLKYIAPSDIHVYSIDEVFMDVTHYLGMFRMTAHQLAMTMIKDVLKQTSITATAGIGPNLYLCKVAMDIVAKKIPPDADGVRIAQLDELEYRRQLWSHLPITDFWRLGRGLAERLASIGLFTMGDVARCSLKNEDLLYKVFGVNAELIIDHAWGYEPCAMEDIKKYKPRSGGFSVGQVLSCPYEFSKAKLVAKEMADELSLNLIEKGLKADSVGLFVGYDQDFPPEYNGPMALDYYGRLMPKAAKGHVKFELPTASSSVLKNAIAEIFDSTVDASLSVRRLYVNAECKQKAYSEQLDLFDGQDATPEETSAMEEKEKKQLEAAVAIKKRFGKNMLLRASDLEEGATARLRNNQIGGHNA